jgi:hypothetical protein
MKRLVILLTVFMLLLTACSKFSDTPPVLPQSFETDLIVRFNESEMTAHWKRDGIGSNSIKMLTPETIKGMELKIEGSKCTVTFEDLSFDLDLNRFPQTAFSTELVNSFEQIINNTEVTVNKRDEVWEYKGVNSTGSYILRQNADTGFLEFFSVPSLDLTVDFENFKKLK